MTGDAFVKWLKYPSEIYTFIEILKVVRKKTARWRLKQGCLEYVKITFPQALLSRLVLELPIYIHFCVCVIFLVTDRPHQGRIGRRSLWVDCL